MDLRAFYQKLRQLERSIVEPHVVISSEETPDGGRAGVLTETPRELAARLVVEGKARLATPEEAQKFREEAAEAKRLTEQAIAASRVQVTVLSEADLRGLRSAGRATKS
jgi:hypothetical protein